MEDQYVSLYRAALPRLLATAPAAMNALRTAAIDAYHMPTRKQEDYRYTDVAQAFRPDYGVALNSYPQPAAPYTATLRQAPAAVQARYGTIASTTDPLTALNTAIAPDCLVVHVPAGEKPKAPIRIDNTFAGDTQMTLRRLLIVLDPGAEATVIIVDKSATDRPTLALQVVEAHVAAGATLDISEVENTHADSRRFAALYIDAERHATVRHNNITLGAGTTRNAITVNLREPEADALLTAAVIADDRQHVDNNVLVRHQAPHCHSDVLYKYVLDAAAVGAFAARTLVEQGAVGTVSNQTNGNICCSPEARMYSQPMLEIYADDVKCAHGATAGLIDPQQLFYLNQRGIPTPEARNLLKQAYLADVLARIHHAPQRDQLQLLIARRLSGQQPCTTCNICK